MSSEPVFKCVVCKAEFGTWIELLRHIKEEHDPQKNREA
jgi:hypothetical protein